MKKILNALDVDKIKNYIKENGLTVREFAAKCKLSKSSVYKMLGKYASGSVSTAYKISKGLGVPFHKIFLDCPTSDLFVEVDKNDNIIRRGVR